MMTTWMSRWKLGSMDRISGLFHLPINGVYWVYNPLILTIDPNFLQHPSRWWFQVFLYFCPDPWGDDSQFDLRIFFKWGG